MIVRKSSFSPSLTYSCSGPYFAVLARWCATEVYATSSVLQCGSSASWDATLKEATVKKITQEKTEPFMHFISKKLLLFLVVASC